VKATSTPSLAWSRTGHDEELALIVDDPDARIRPRENARPLVVADIPASVTTFGGTRSHRRRDRGQERQRQCALERPVPPIGRHRLLQGVRARRRSVGSPTSRSPSSSPR